MIFGGIKVPEVSDKQWQKFADVKSALGLRHNSPPALAKLAEVIGECTFIPHPIATALARILTKYPMDKIGLSEKETGLVIEFLTENRKGINLVLGGKEILDAVLPKEEDKPDGRKNKSVATENSGKPKKKRKTRSDKGKKKPRAKVLVTSGVDEV